MKPNVKSRVLKNLVAVAATESKVRNDAQHSRHCTGSLSQSVGKRIRRVDQTTESQIHFFIDKLLKSSQCDKRYFLSQFTHVIHGRSRVNLKAFSDHLSLDHGISIGRKGLQRILRDYLLKQRKISRERLVKVHATEILLRRIVSIFETSLKQRDV